MDVDASYFKVHISAFVLLERLIMAGLVIYIFFKNSIFITDKLRTAMKIYVIGICIYLIFMGFPLPASRLAVQFKIMETFIISGLILGCKKFRARKLIIIFIFLITVIMFLKNIKSYISQGKYFDVEIWNYPYISIFNTDEIYKYRNINIYLNQFDS